MFSSYLVKKKFKIDKKFNARSMQNIGICKGVLRK